MSLSNDLISQFVKVTKDDNRSKEGATVNGRIVIYNDTPYVRLDGSDLLTPVTTTVDVRPNEHVTVLIKDHNATVTGNVTSPAARTDDVNEIGRQMGDLGDEVLKIGTVVADKVDTIELEAQIGRIDELVSNNITVNEKLTTNEADIRKLTADYVEVNGKLDANEGYIHDLQVDKLDAKEAEIKYANIDFANIGKAAIEEFFAKSGMIQDMVVGDGVVTGKLVGVTIVGDLIEGGTVVADKLVVKGEDGLYYKLNTDGVKTEAEQTEYNSIHGSIITAQSITATKINVSDLVAFNATIGGFKITDSSLYSGVKESVNNTTRGIFLGDDSQVAIGDSNNFLKFYKDTNGEFKLDISAKSIKFSPNGKTIEEQLNTQQNNIELIRDLVEGIDDLSSYVVITTINGQPCLELGNSSTFKIRITNTEISFIDGGAVPAYISNKTLKINKAEVDDELGFGGFAFKARENNNMGLVWKGLPTSTMSLQQPKNARAIGGAVVGVPTIQACGAYRCDANGTPSDFGKYYVVTVKWFNEGPVKLLVSRGTWGTSGVVPDYGQKELTEPGVFTTPKLGDNALNPNVSYFLEVRLYDSNTGSIAEQTLALPAAKFPIDFKSGGNGVAIGKEADVSNCFDVAWPTSFRDQVFDMSGTEIKGYDFSQITPINYYRFANTTIGFFDSYYNAANNLNRKGFMGFGTSSYFQINSLNETGIRLTGGIVDVDGRLRANNLAAGRITLTPTANDTTVSVHLSFGKTFPVAPTVVTGMYSTVPGSNVLGVAAYNITTTGCDIYLRRTNVVTSSVSWIAYVE